MIDFEAEIQSRLEDAQPPAITGGNETRRLEAVKWLLAVRRVQIGKGGAAAVHPDINLFFARAANSIWSAPDPLAAMDDLLNGAETRGRHPSEAETGLALVIQVRRLLRSGKTVDKAIREISKAQETARDRKKDDLSGAETAFARVHRQYYRAKKNRRVRAALADLALKAK